MEKVEGAVDLLCFACKNESEIFKNPTRKIQSVQYLLFSLNLVCALGGVSIVWLGATVRPKLLYWEIFSLELNLRLPVTLLMTVGAAICIFAMYGCCVTVFLSRRFVMNYGMLMWMMFAVKVALVSYVFVILIQNDAGRRFSERLDPNKSYFAMLDSEKILLHKLEKLMGCCGINGKPKAGYYMGDANNTQLFVPGSCCGREYFNQTCELAEVKSLKSCDKQLYPYLERSMILLGVVALGVAGLESLGTVFYLYLAILIFHVKFRRYKANING